MDEIEVLQRIEESKNNFDINAPLTDDEIAQLNGVVAESRRSKVPVVQDLDTLDDTPADVVAAAISSDPSEYNAQYLRYLKCQALASLLAFKEGWSALDELVIQPYLSARRREDLQYQGDSPNKAFSIRLRRQEAENFMRYINVSLVELAGISKPQEPKR